MRFRASVDVAARPDVVFAIVGDHREDPRWRAGVTTMDPRPPAPARVGTTTHEVVRFLGTTYRTPGDVTGVVAGELMRWRAAGPRLIASGSRRVEAAGDRASRVTVATEIRLRGGWRLLEPVLAPLYGRRLRADLDRLRRLI